MKFKWFIVLCVLWVGCNNHVDPNRKYAWKTARVTATAYNSTVAQTNSNPHIGAFGDSIKPGMKYIAVSRDLYRQGMKHNTLVKIEGLKGLYTVKDRMHSRWKNKIDIYMGTDVDSARNWGRKKVTIQYRVPNDSK